jgi:hypothetical protein
MQKSGFAGDTAGFLMAIDPVKLHPDNLGDVFAIVAYGPTYVDVRKTSETPDKVRRFTVPVVITPEKLVAPWEFVAFRDAQAGYAHGKGVSEASPQNAHEQGGFSVPQFLAEDFAAIAALKPEIVLLGTGEKLRFPNPRIFAPLREAKIGFEVMDTQAACRTYNILLAESRKVAAALVF